MKYNTRYILKQDIPGYNKGRELIVETVDGELKWKFCKWSDMFNRWDRLYTEGDISFSLDEIQDSRFFEPIGTVRELIPSFPNKKEIEDFYHLIGEPRLVDSVDFIRTSTPIFYSDEFQDAVYELFKEMYNKKYGLLS